MPVLVAAFLARARLDEYRVAIAHQFSAGGRDEADTAFAGLELARHTDLHKRLLLRLLRLENREACPHSKPLNHAFVSLEKYTWRVLGTAASSSSVPAPPGTRPRCMRRGPTVNPC